MWVWPLAACSSPPTARAGWGVYWGEGDPENIGRPLAGLQQTNQRAELRAALRAVNRGADEVRTDSQYVIDGVACLVRGQRRGPVRDADHEDLWGQMQEALQRRPRGEAVVFTKVLGHAKEEDVRENRTTRADKVGNDAADKLAVDAALSHAAPKALLNDLKRRRELARDVQLMMLDISDAALQRDNEQKQGGPPQPPGEPPPPSGGAGAQRAPSDTRPEEGAAEPPAYPWGWDPPGSRTQVEVPELPAPSRWQGASFIWGARLWAQLRAYVAALRWPAEETPGGEGGISFLELAMDFEVSMGEELPFPKKQGATGPAAFVHAGSPGVAGRSPASAADRARLFGQAWRCLERRSGKQLHPGRKDARTKTLRPLGYWPPLSGFSRRPLLLGGEATEKALRGLLGLSGPGAPISGNPLALRRRPAYRADRGCLIPGAEAPGGGDDGQLGKRDREGVAEPPGAKTGPSAGSPETSGEEPAQPQAGTKGKRRPPAIIRLPAKERKAVYAKVAPGQGKHKLKKFGKTWRCILCNRPGFNNPSQLRATICFGKGMKGGKVISLQKKEAARARHLQEAEQARVHNAAVAAGGPGFRKHVLVPGGDTHTCEACGLKVTTVLRARNLNKACRAQDPESDSDNDIPPAERHVLRQVKDKPGVWECIHCERRESQKRLIRTRCRGPGAKTKSELLALANAERSAREREREREDNRKHNAAVLAAGKGDLRHVPVTKGDSEVCEVCGRKVVASYNNRSRFMAGVCPGAPKALPPEEAARLEKTREYKRNWKARRLLADARAQGGATTAPAGPVPPKNPPKGRQTQPTTDRDPTPQGQGKLKLKKGDTPGAMRAQGDRGRDGDCRATGLRGRAFCRPRPGLEQRTVGGDGPRTAARREKVARAPAPQRAPPAAAARPKPKRQPQAGAAAAGRKPQPKRRGRAAPSAPE